MEGIDPVIFFGINNVNFEVIQKNFPKLKLVARGSRVKIVGTAPELAKFDSFFEIIKAYILKYNSLTKETLASFFTEDGPSLMTSSLTPEGILIYGTNGQSIKARTIHQKDLIENYKDNDLIFAIGPAGTGKTYIAIALAVRAFKNKQVKRIILSRPAVEAGESLGFLPGDMKDKLDPYLQPLYDALIEMIPHKKLADLFEDGAIQIAPLAYMRGRTLSNAFVILDEAQNATVKQLKMFLTRMGENSKFIVTGDITQIDLPDKRNSGLVLARNILQGIDGISVIDFDQNDIIRHKLVKDIVNAYSNIEKKEDTDN